MAEQADMAMAATTTAEVEDEIIRMSMLNYERLPMLDVIFERFVLSFSSSLKSLTGSVLDVTLGEVEYLPFAESVELMKNRQLDATLQSSGLGSAALKDLSATQDVTFVSVPAEVAETLGAPYAAGVIPAGTYPGQDADIPTLAITNILVTSSDVSDELAYEMTKLLFENLEQMKAAHAAAGAINIEDAIANSPIPLHPGAEKYYKEQGLM